MQPLSYQVLPASCWVTSMLNGILYLVKDNRKMPPLAYRLLHELLTDDGVFYYNKTQRNSFDAVVKAVETCTGLDIKAYRGDEVVPKIKQLHFQDQVAICDINTGDHSILLNGINNGWLEGFDPYWDSVKKKRAVKNSYETLPKVGKGAEGTVNILINLEYLVSKRRTNEFQIGAVKTRFLSVIEKSKYRR